MRSINYRNIGKTRLLKGKINQDNYIRYVLIKDNVKNYVSASRLVWEKSKGPIPEGYEIGHKDENRSNNRLDNLVMLTHYDNIHLGTGIQRHTETQSNPVLQYDLQGNFIKEWSSASMAAKTLGYKWPWSVSHCASGKFKTAYGYVWRYKNRNKKS